MSEQNLAVLDKRRHWACDGNSVVFFFFSGSSFNRSILAFVSCRSGVLQDGSLCADHCHRDGHPHNDLHRHREIPGHRVPAENEEALLAEKSIQDARCKTDRWLDG